MTAPLRRPQLLAPLTPRQRLVLSLIAKGHTNPQIAEQLGVTLDGAKWHVREILSKLGVDSREEAAKWWREEHRTGRRLQRALGAMAAGMPLRWFAAATAGAVGVVLLLALFPLIVPGSSGGEADAPPASEADGGDGSQEPPAEPPAILVTPSDRCPVTTEQRWDAGPAPETMAFGPPESPLVAPPITAMDADGFVAGAYSPKGALPGGILMAEDIRDQPDRMYRWTPGRAPQPLWSTPLDLQDLSYWGGGDWLAVLRTGKAGPMSKWTLMLLQGVDGEPCLLSTNDPFEAPGDVQRYGWIGPGPVMDGDRIVWQERYSSDNGERRKRMVLYDIPTGRLEVLADRGDVTSGDLWSPSISGEWVAWLEQDVGQPAHLTVASTDGQVRRTAQLPRQPTMALVANGGRHLILDYPEERTSTDLTTGETIRFTGAVGSFTGGFGEGRYYTWWPVKGHVGYFDTATGTVHLVDTGDADTLGAVPFGGYFVWQERRPVPGRTAPGGGEYLESKFYAIQLP